MCHVIKSIKLKIDIETILNDILQFHNRILHFLQRQNINTILIKVYNFKAKLHFLPPKFQNVAIFILY